MVNILTLLVDIRLIVLLILFCQAACSFEKLAVGLPRLHTRHIFFLDFVHTIFNLKSEFTVTVIVIPLKVQYKAIITQERTQRHMTRPSSKYQDKYKNIYQRAAACA